ncbi:MAG: carboxymuconolactone decarboxylase family protein [Proteobacteria bacterium]|nr:carboxymuconolactone decarboxylase family protein [Pseudomonadota bacterium]
MQNFTKPAPRIKPLPPNPMFADIFSMFTCVGAIVPNALLIMQHRPKILRAFVQLMGAIADPETSKVEGGLKRLIAHVASRAAGCHYCMSHTTALAQSLGVDDAKLEGVWEYATSALFSEAERAALDVALAAGGVPNGVTDEMFAELRKHWSDDQIVEIVAVIAQFGFLNRWNDTLATPIENEALAVGEKYLAPHGWEAGRHARSA